MGQRRLNSDRVFSSTILCTSSSGTSTITVKGVTKLGGAKHRINPDRIEAGTFLVAGAITGGDLCVAHCNPGHVQAVMGKLQECGVRIDVIARDQIRVRSEGVLKAADIPSVLVEMGFMSNPRDEAELRRPEHRKTIAIAMKRAVDAFFAARQQMAASG